ncbi:unnamed protein product [Orchesella dallaii]|uniref:Extracellular exo-alpha-(1->5)-L-arabinofuranosidase n=1 Tax=Orchesella dallaii TaxID=48710 RepID=A0ABP1QFK0_9HEXA
MNRLLIFYSICIFICILISTAVSQLTFTNPIIDTLSADPCVLRVGDNYYLTISEKGETELTIYKSPILTSFRNAESKVAFVIPPESRDMWASEMHEVDGELYIYFTMSTNGDNHRMYVLKAENASNPMGNWSLPLRLLPDWDFAAIDGTIMRHNRQKYFVWTSGRIGTLAIYIAPMVNATLIARPIVLLRQPTQEWECGDGCVNEGPFFIYNRNVSYMIFSGSSTWDPGYALSQMSIESGKDPLDPLNWDSVEGPLFWRNDEEDVYNTGHAAFTVSPGNFYDNIIIMQVIERF